MKNEEDFKTTLANFSHSVINEPNNNISQLADILKLYITTKDINSKSLVILSLTEIFKLIIPLYKIPTKYSNEKVSKAVYNMRSYEKTLLKSYLTFIHILQKNILRNNSKNNYLSSTSIFSITKLYESTYHFNYSEKLINILLTLANNKNSKISNKICKSIKSVLEKITLKTDFIELIKAITHFVKKKNFVVRKEIVKLICDINMEEKTLNNGINKHNSNNNIDKNYSKILEEIFIIFFSYLKLNWQRNSAIYCDVLRGITNYVSKINVELVVNLIECLQERLNDENLSFELYMYTLKAIFDISGRNYDSFSIIEVDYNTTFLEKLNQLILIDNMKYIYVTFDCINHLISRKTQLNKIDFIVKIIKKLCVISLYLPFIMRQNIDKFVNNIIMKYERNNIIKENIYKTFEYITFKEQIDKLGSYGVKSGVGHIDNEFCERCCGGVFYIDYN